MDSKDIEARVQKIEDDIAELHAELTEDHQTAWLNVPALRMETKPNLYETELSFQIGRAEKI